MTTGHFRIFVRIQSDWKSDDGIVLFLTDGVVGSAALVKSVDAFLVDGGHAVALADAGAHLFRHNRRDAPVHGKIEGTVMHDRVDVVGRVQIVGLFLLELRIILYSSEMSTKIMLMFLLLILCS